MNADDRLLPQTVRERLSTARFGRRIYYLPEVNSTNRIASELAKSGEAEGTVVITDYQRKGRGRLDRIWESPPLKNLLFSVILRPKGHPAGVLPLTLAFSVAIGGSLSRLLKQKVQVKWPNDIVCGEGKLCGILAESASRSGQSLHVIVGVGVNVNAAREDFDPSIRDRLESFLTLTGTNWNRAEVLSEILQAMETCYLHFQQGGFAVFTGEYNKNLSISGRTVSFEKDGKNLNGTVRGVREDGALMVILPTSKRVFLYNEEISVV